MSTQGPILFVANEKRLPLAVALDDCKLFPLIEASWSGASDAVSRLVPAAVVTDMRHAPAELVRSLAMKCARDIPYLPMIGIDSAETLPDNVLPFSSGRGFDGLLARLNAAMRVRALAAAVERRIADGSSAIMPASDVLDEATILLVGRGGSYPALSVALGERVAVVGALGLDVARKHLEARDIDGIVVGTGFNNRMIEDFLRHLTGDARFRHLPVIVGAVPPEFQASDTLANLEICAGDAAATADVAMPLVRQTALQSRLVRVLKAIESNGAIDAASGLMTADAFHAEFDRAVTDSVARGANLSAARFQFKGANDRAQIDAARILGRLVRRFDFATLNTDGAILAVFAETDLRQGHIISRRIASVVKHTLHAAKRDAMIEPQVTVATMLARDSAHGILARLTIGDRRKAS